MAVAVPLVCCRPCIAIAIIAAGVDPGDEEDGSGSGGGGDEPDDDVVEDEAVVVAFAVATDTPGSSF